MGCLRTQKHWEGVGVFCLVFVGSGCLWVGGVMSSIKVRRYSSFSIWNELYLSFFSFVLSLVLLSLSCIRIGRCS